MASMREPARRRLVLVGAGHAHLAVLARFAMRPVSGLRLTLVTDVDCAAYSGMIPAVIAGRAAPEEAEIDLVRLARFAGARLLATRAVGLDPVMRRLALADRPDLGFDVVSLDVGSERRASFPGATEVALQVRPPRAFLAAWDDLVARAPAPSLVVVGGGLAGIEIALALASRIAAEGRAAGGARVTLVTRGPLAPRRPEAGRRRLAAALREAGVGVATGVAPVAAREGALLLDDGRALPCDALVLATGPAAPAWLAGTRLLRDEAGFLRVDRTLRAIGHPHVFAAGDVASLDGVRHERSGVIAVRQGPVLADNLRRALLGERLRVFRPQRHALALVGDGDGGAIALRGRLAARGRAWGLLKRAIDRRWLAGYSRRPTMDPARPPSSDRLPDAPVDAPMRCGGCAAKLPADALARALARLDLDAAGPGDAAPLPAAAAGETLVQSVDWFPAMVEDPFLLGRIAANHALGDLWAVGARPLAALAVASLPAASPDAMEDDLVQMLAGALPVFAEAGARLVGGHSAEADGLGLGFAVTGAVGGDRPAGKAGLAPGDRLVLTKPLGVGVVAAAAMRGEPVAAAWSAALAVMAQPQGRAAAILSEHGARASTDVTGFGLAGHLLELLDAADLDAVLDLDALPALDEALALLARGITSTLHADNARIGGRIVGGGGPRRALLHDPQTAGGLLAGVPAARADACVAALREAGYVAAAIVGTVGARGGDAPTLRLGEEPRNHPPAHAVGPAQRGRAVDDAHAHGQDHRRPGEPFQARHR